MADPIFPTSVTAGVDDYEGHFPGCSAVLVTMNGGTCPADVTDDGDGGTKVNIPAKDILCAEEPPRQICVECLDDHRTYCTDIIC